MGLIVYSIPLFFLLIGVELLIAKMKKLSYYRFNDAVTNLSCGIGSQVSGIFLKVFTILVYIKLYQLSPLKGRIPTTWWSYVLLFFAVDFFYYWFHRLAHEISFMWGSHVVHHQSEEYNLTVALRQAWYQGAFSFVFYLPLAVLGFDPVMFIVISQLVTLYQFWIHTKLIKKLPRPIEFFFNTPSHHRVHHGVNPQYIDKNHAGTFIIWDRMFGTFEPEVEEVVYGITKQPNSWNPIWLNFEYWWGLFKDLFKVHKIKEGVYMLVKMPGWKPKELGGSEIPKPVSVQTFHKYDTDIPAGLNYYVLFQFVMVLVGTTIFLQGEAKPPFTENILLKIGVASLIIYSLFNIGGIFEKRSWVPALEYLRLIITAIVVILLLQNLAAFTYAAAAIAAVAVVSVVWFSRYYSEFKIKTV
ncbi:MAG TPA: sterol desaturase family protein [Chitinophagales bacterium]|nr:sterol desaturase family protein [Chitinophagales bacterium]